MTKNLCNATLLGLVISLPLASCKRIPPPNVEMNPAPKERYRMTLTVSEGVKSVGNVKAQITYSIANYKKCQPIDYGRSLGGSYNHYLRYVPIEVKEISSGVYEAYFYADKILNEDYYGLGKCNWDYGGASFELDVHGSSLGLSPLKKTFEAQSIEKRLCPKDSSVPHNICRGVAYVPPEDRSRYFPVLVEIHRE